MINTAILILILLINATWATIWFYRKTKTLEYRVGRFIRSERVKPRIGGDTKVLSEDAMIQIFLRCGNENFREDLRKDFHKNLFIKLVESYIKRECVNTNGKGWGGFIINSKAKFVVRQAPVAPPIEKDDNLIEL